MSSSSNNPTPRLQWSKVVGGFGKRKHMLQDGKHRSLTLIGNRIYFFSNRRGCWYCDRTSGRWVKVVRFERDMLQYHVSVLVQDKIYIVSGPTLRRRMIGFDPVTKELESLRAPLIASDEWGKIALVYVPWRDEVILIWSFTTLPSPSYTHVYNISRRLWKHMSFKGQLPRANSPEAALHGRKLFVCPGHLHGVENSCLWVADLRFHKSYSWSKLKIGGCPNVSALSLHAIDGRVLLLGGWKNDEEQLEAWVFTLETGKWTKSDADGTIKVKDYDYTISTSMSCGDSVLILAPNQAVKLKVTW